MPSSGPRPVITPAFPEFLPPWVARQPWYRGYLGHRGHQGYLRRPRALGAQGHQGEGTPSLTMVGALRLEDPDGAVGIETHLVSDGAAVYQVPMTYRGAPLPGAGPADLIVTAEHSVLGTRWIYDAEADPVWRREILRLVRDGGVMEQVAPDGTVVCAARGRPLGDAGVANGGLAIELRRVLVPGEPADEVATAAGIVTGTWRPFGRDREPVTGCLAITVASPSSVSDHPAP